MTSQELNSQADEIRSLIDSETRENLPDLSFDFKAKLALMEKMLSPEWMPKLKGDAVIPTIVVDEGCYIQLLFGEYHLFVEDDNNSEHDVNLDEWQFREPLDKILKHFGYLD